MTMQHDPQQIRKMLVWGIPLFLGLGACAFWMVPLLILPTIDGILGRAPAVRITPGALLSPFVGIFSVLAIVIAVLRAIPYKGKSVHMLEKTFNITVLASFIALALIGVAATQVQDRYMPDLGYSRCELLQGNPTIWFTDWVKDPQWCVRGKTPEWVNEQAASVQARP